MKKLIPIILVLALAVIIMCFAACGNNNVDENLTSMSNEMTSIMDDATTLGEELEEDLSDITDDMSTSEDLTDEDMSGTSTTENESTSANGTTAE